MPFRNRPKNPNLCTNCNERQPREGFKRCQHCYDTYKAWQQKNPDSAVKAKKTFKNKHPHSERDRKRELRVAAIKAYGGICTCCKEIEPIFLAIDHVDGVKQEPYEKKLRGDALYAWLKREGYPAGYQIMCNNCNWAIRFGICPHKKGWIDVT